MIRPAASLASLYSFAAQRLALLSGRQYGTIVRRILVCLFSAPEARQKLAQPVRAGNVDDYGFERRRCGTICGISAVSTPPLACVTQFLLCFTVVALTASSAFWGAAACRRFYGLNRSIALSSSATEKTPLVVCSAGFHASALRLSDFPFSIFNFLSITAPGVGFTLPPQSTLTVHEWGTFTSIAGPDGLAMDWLPLTGSTDLPSFVEHLQNANFKGGLRGTIRMETPVLYFYSPQETTVSVHATFSKGLITEWYPHASVPSLDRRHDFTLEQKRTEGAITWNSVQIQPATPDDFPTDASANHYYAARQTSSAPLTIDSANGPQHEKFLFYRGVSALLPPLTAALSPDGTILLQNHLAVDSPNEIPNVILFERRGDKLGYRILSPLQDQASLAPPALDGSLDSLFSDLEGLLISQGLFADEAHAMLETWKSSWFEEGSRVLYIVPRPFVDSVLPLAITPAPAQITRVFVGRLELITPGTEQAVESAFATGDRATLAKYNRFLDPILRSMIDSAPDELTRDRLTSYLSLAFTNFSSQPQKPF